jgi:diguanylate cyclase (GGDEF)-like protein/PAS domain S-box-containing protein
MPKTLTPHTTDLEAILASAPDGMVVTDPDGHVLYANAAAARLLDRSAEELVGQSLRLPAAGNTDVTEIDVPGKLERRVLDVRAVPTRWEGRPASLATLRDVTERRRAESALRKERRTLEAVFQASPLPIARLDRDWNVEMWNRAGERIFGWTEDELIGRPLPLLPATSAERRGLRERLGAGDRPLRLETRRAKKNGSPVDISMSMSALADVDGRSGGVVAIVDDITERKREEEHMRYLAAHDSLTGLANRRRFEEALGSLVERASGRAPSALLLLDVDDLKAVNDAAGHAAGDQLLVAIARLLNQTVRPGDLVARVGGDEVGVLLEGVCLEEARTIAERLRSRAEQFLFCPAEHVFDVSVSIGIAPLDGRLGARAAMSLADRALYAAKDGGKNSVVVLDGTAPAPERPVAEDWARRIGEALGAAGFVLEFQPVVALAGEDVAHVEALVRMPGGRGGELILPRDFMPAAERFRLTRQIDRWVIDHALTLLAEHPQVQMFVNLSEASVEDPALLAWLGEKLAAAHVDARRLGFDVGERTVAAGSSEALMTMTELDRLGCVLAIDDFGSRLSSFADLQRAPGSFVKVDRRVVSRLGTEPGSRTMIQAISGACRAIGKELIAEGVETERQADAVRDLGAAFGQGYHWGRPGIELPAMRLAG